MTLGTLSARLTLTVTLGNQGNALLITVNGEFAMTVLVYGSLNMDLVAYVPRLPAPGETLSGKHFSMVSGGKGANQALAASRLGVPTSMIGRVGSDSFGKALVASLGHDRVDCSAVLVDSTSPTGVALIVVDDRGDNSIVVVPGANGQVGQAEGNQLRTRLSSAKVLLLQLEIPLTEVMAAAAAAKAAKVLTIVDPAPAQALPKDFYPLIDMITPNQVEASQLTAIEVVDIPSALRAATVLQQWGVATVIITLGSQGSVCVSASETIVMPAYRIPGIDVVDTVAAGDAFNGALAAALAQDHPLGKALHWATVAAAISVTRAGAQSSLPTKADLEHYLEHIVPWG